MVFPGDKVVDVVSDEVGEVVEGVPGEGLALGVLDFDFEEADGGGFEVDFEGVVMEAEGFGDELTRLEGGADGGEPVGAKGASAPAGVDGDLMRCGGDDVGSGEDAGFFTEPGVLA